MSSNFHNLLGWHLGGLEFHEYKAVAGELKYHPHASGDFLFIRPAATLWKKASQVTAEGWSMLQQGYDYYLIPHFPVPVPPPEPAAEAATLIKVIADSGSKLQMAVHSVTSGSEALACCLQSSLSSNLNCSENFDVPLNVVINLNSVETQPTAGDYLGALVGAAADAALKALVLGATKRVSKKFVPDEEVVERIERTVDHVWRRAPDVIPQLDIPSLPSKWVQKTVDGEAQ